MENNVSMIYEIHLYNDLFFLLYLLEDPFVMKTLRVVTKLS